MNKIHKKRLYVFSFIAIGVTCALSLILYALKQNINVYMTPHELMNHTVPADYRFRLGGMVKPGSLQHNQALQVSFVVTDFKQDVRVSYHGILPDLFREGKGVIAEGYLNSQGIFVATLVLAKHDENYMPKGLYKKMRMQ